MADVLFVIAFLALVILGTWFIFWADRQRVVRLITQRGGKVLHAERTTLPFPRRLLELRDTTFWLVTYEDAAGDLRLARCRSSFLTCTLERDESIETSREERS